MKAKKKAGSSSDGEVENQGQLFDDGEATGLDVANRFIRTETVISKMPFHVLYGKRQNPAIKITRRGPNGQTELFWELAFNGKYGPPGPMAYALDTLVVNRKIDELPRPLPKTIRVGSLSGICRDLDYKLSGKNKRGVRNALLQNAFTGISAKLSYKGTDGREYNLDANFNRYSVVLVGERLPDGQVADAVYIVLNEIYWEVLNRAPTRPLDFHYLKSLSPAPRRWYEIISFRIFAALKNGQPAATISYSDYCTFSAQLRYFDFGSVNRQMKALAQPHLKSGYISKFFYEETRDAEGQADWMISYVPGPKAKAEYEKAAKGIAVKQAADGRCKEQGRGDGALASASPAEDSPEALVRYFHLLWRKKRDYKPKPVELRLAEYLIAAHGAEAVRFLCEYAVRRAPETNFNMSLFSAVKVYVDDALEAFRQTAARRRKADEEVAAPKDEEADLQHSAITYWWLAEDTYRRGLEEVLSERVVAGAMEKGMKQRILEKVAELRREGWDLERVKAHLDNERR